MSEPRGLVTERSRDGGLLWIVLDEPPGNVLSIELMGEVARTLDREAAREDLKLVALRGAGGHFCYGASIQQHRRQQAAPLLSEFHRLVRRLASFPAPVAALVEGRCLGAGFELALCCDLLFTTAQAELASPEIRLGVFPPVLAAIGAVRLGPFLAARMLLTGESVSGRELVARGVAVPVEASDPASGLVAWYDARLAPISAFSLRQATLALRESSGLVAQLGEPLAVAERRYLDHLIPSHDGNEGIEAFLDKRSPVWRNA